MKGKTCILKKQQPGFDSGSMIVRMGHSLMVTLSQLDGRNILSKGIDDTRLPAPNKFFFPE